MSQHPVDARLATFAQRIRSSPHNLMSARGLGELESRHLPECAALAALVPPGRLVDVGSGAGLPGIVIAVLRADVAVTLVEATTKKARFLERMRDELEIDVEVRNERVEETAAARPATYDVATARAVAPLRRLVPWAVPLLRPGGLLYAVKGARWHEEVEEAREVIARAGASVVAVPPDPRASDPNVDPPLRTVIIAASAR